ncbi:MAG: hypothetical protein ACTJHU_02840 [Mycetocola sp.]
MSKDPGQAPTRTTVVPAHTLLVGCGRVGIALSERLTQRGGTVTAIRRHVDTLPSTVTGLAIDLSAPVPEPLPAVDAMVITITPSIGGTGTPPGYLRALENLAEALPSRPARTIFVSSTGVFEGKDRGFPLTESDRPHPATPRGLLLRAGEEKAHNLFGASIVRPAGIYGPGRDRLLRLVSAATAVPYTQRTNRIHEWDLVSALELMLTLPVAPPLLHAVDSAPAPLGDVVTFIAGELGVAPPPAATAEPSGTVFDGTLLRGLLGNLRYPGYVDGYRELCAQWSTPQ